MLGPLTIRLEVTCSVVYKKGLGGVSRLYSSVPLSSKRRQESLGEAAGEEKIESPLDMLFGTGAKTPVVVKSELAFKQGTAAKLRLPPNAVLTWRGFFRKRWQRKSCERWFAASLGLVSFSASLYYVSFVKEFDPTVMFFGIMDPSIAYMLMSFAGGALGACGGVFFGRLVWNRINYRLLHEMDIRDKIFDSHLAVHRAPSTAHSVDMPIPDFYGEKIKSLRGYRSWIRKHRKHMKKVGLAE